MSDDAVLGAIILQTLDDLGEGVVTGEGVKFGYVNDAFCRLVGYSREELLAMRTIDLVPPEDLEAMTRRAQTRSSRADISAPEETRLVHKDGHRITIESSTRRLGIPGQPAFIGIIRDITSRKVAEEKARSETITRRLVRQMMRHVAERMGRERNAAFMRDVGRRVALDVEAATLPDHVAAFNRTGLGRLTIMRDESGRAHVLGDDLLQRSPNATQPTCGLVVGYLEAAVGTITGREALGSEIRCQSMGHDSCEFVVLSR